MDVGYMAGFIPMCKDTSDPTNGPDSKSRIAQTMAQLSRHVGTARRSHHHQPQIRICPGSCRHGSVRCGQCIRVVYHCVHRNRLAMADAQPSPCVVPLAIPFRRSIPAGSSLSHLHHIRGGDHCFATKSGEVDRESFRRVAIRIVLSVSPEWPVDSPSRTAHILTVALHFPCASLRPPLGRYIEVPKRSGFSPSRWVYESPQISLRQIMIVSSRGLLSLGSCRHGLRAAPLWP